MDSPQAPAITQKSPNDIDLQMDSIELLSRAVHTFDDMLYHDQEEMGEKDWQYLRDVMESQGLMRRRRREVSLICLEKYKG